METLNMSCPCTEMSAWWWLIVNETCNKRHVTEYIVVFWLNDHFGYTTTQRDGYYKIKLCNYADFGSLTYTLITNCFYFNGHYSISAV